MSPVVGIPRWRASARRLVGWLARDGGVLLVTAPFVCSELSACLGFYCTQSILTQTPHACRRNSSVENKCASVGGFASTRWCRVPRLHVIRVCCGATCRVLGLSASRLVLFRTTNQIPVVCAINASCDGQPDELPGHHC